MSLVDSALITPSQLTRDVGAAMSSAVLARRQVWLAQTSLPEGVRKDLIKMAVVPGKVFHPDSQGVFDSAEQSRRTRESVRRTFGRAAPSSYQHRAPVLAGRAGARAWSMPSLGAEDPHSVSQPISCVFSPGHPPKRSTLPELQNLGVEPPSGVKPPAEAVSQLRLSSWVECVSDQWVLATVANGYRIQFRRRPPPFSGV